MRGFVAIACAMAGCFTVPARGATLKKAAVIDLHGPRGEHFDHLAMDYDDHYLLSAQTGAGILYVIDVRRNAVVAAIHGLPGITVPVYVPGMKKVYACDWGENKIGVVNLKQMKVVKRLASSEKPNGGTYAAAFGKIYISDTLGRELQVIDARTDAPLQTLRFASETGMVQDDEIGRKVWVNLRNANEIAEIDPRKDAVAARYRVAGCDFNHAMAIDAKNRRAFLLCVGNNVFTVFDLGKHRAIAHIPLPEGADDVKFDPILRRIYVACESGAITVIEEEDADHFRKLEDFPVQKGVHTLEVDAETHRVYTPEAEEDGKPVCLVIVYEAVMR